MDWDNLSLIILAAFGCLTLLLTQISEFLSKLPEIIRAWQRVREELRGGDHRHGSLAVPPAQGDDDRATQTATARLSGSADLRTSAGERRDPASGN